MHPILSPAIFAERRKTLMQQLPEGSAVLLFASREQTRNSDIHYPFRQDSYFWYFSGFPEAEAVLLIQNKDNHLAHTTLFSTERNPLREIWEGKIIGQDSAKSDYGMNDARPLSELTTLANTVLSPKAIYTILGLNPDHDHRALTLLRELHSANGRGGAEISGLLDLRRIADEMRLIKDHQERTLLHQAGKISALGHQAAMRATKHSTHEYQIQAALEHAYHMQGCHWSFPSIVAGGSNACCLHYRANNQPLQEGNLVLVDSGAEYAGYAGDITRTFPKNGCFTATQQALYEVVLNAELEAIAACKPGISHNEIHQITCRVLAQGLLDLGIITGTLDYWLENEQIKQFFPHGTGHWLGLDVHDVGIYKPEGKWRTYQSGMVITIEPGLYIQPNNTSVAEKWRGIGIRIEDDVIITDSGHEITSADVVKTPQEIEAFMRSN